MGVISSYLGCGTQQEVHDDGKLIQGWKLPASRTKIIENRNGDTRGGIGDFGNTKEFADRLTSRRRVFAFYALINTSNPRTGRTIIYTPQGFESLRAEFIQFSQDAKIPMNHEKTQYLESLRKVDHENIAKFYGLQINDEEPSTMTFFHYLVERATLEEFCLDPNFPMGERYKSSFMNNILDGLEYLHRHEIPHGHLYAATCLIDISWILKLSNFGISNFICDQLDNNRASIIPAQQVLHQHYICFPPEHILQYDTTGLKPPRIVRGSLKGDLYSVGMIFYMIIYKKDPFLSANSVDRAYLPAILKENKRPFIDKDIDIGMEQLLIDACEKSWDRDPELRTTIQEFSEIIDKVYPNAQGTLAEQLIQENEKKGAELQILINERNADLKDEMRKTRILLNEMLPPSVVEYLIEGKHIVPRKYESVTVMFVQIVGFLGILQTNTGNQVVNFLNDIFDQFDVIVKENEVYKVETTQETYMAACGVPEENPKHVEIIADTALEIRNIAMSYRMRWKPNYRVKVRIGFHTGPIATGVIGEVSKRFCLFGDTVNVASRMQSTSVENKIQISFQAYSVLKATGEYDLVERGIVFVKGKGDVKCYLLEDKVHKIPSLVWC